MRRTATDRRPRKRVAITGVGVISPLGIGAKAVWQAASRQDIRIVRKTFRLDRTNTRTFFFHKAPAISLEDMGLDDESVNALNSWKEGRVDEDLLWAIAAGRLALDDSKLQYDPMANDISLFVTHENPGLELFFDRTLREAYASLHQRNGRRHRGGREAFITRIYRRCQADGYDAQTFVYLYLIAKVLGVHGHTSYNCNACASGLYALEAAAREIQYGVSPAAVVIGSDHPRYRYKFFWFDQQQLFAPDGLIKPFDLHRDGFTLGDGAAALVLEDWRHAKARRAPIYGEYLGGGFGAQGWKVTMPDLASGVYAKTIRHALAKAALTPGDIDVIVPHGVGTAVGDAYEAKAIREVFGPAQRQPPVTAFKPYFGHNLGGSALLESVLVLLCLRHGMVLPTPNHREADAALDIRIVRQPMRTPLRYAMKTASGFAGFDASVIFGSA